MCAENERFVFLGVGELFDLLGDVFTMSPRGRPNAVQVLDHPFFKIEF
jgi:hypothetical protein